MSNSKVDDYSELVHALQENRRGKANQLLKDVTRRLKDYLRVVLNADEDDAEECIQQVFISVFEQIEKDNIHNEKYIFRYLIKACRNEYFKVAKKNKRFEISIDGYPEHLVSPAEQINNLLDEERQNALSACFEELSEENQSFARYLFKVAGSSSRQLGNHFNITAGNARIKKLRIFEQLSRCVKRRMNG